MPPNNVLISLLARGASTPRAPACCGRTILERTLQARLAAECGRPVCRCKNRSTLAPSSARSAWEEPGSKFASAAGRTDTEPVGVRLEHAVEGRAVEGRAIDATLSGEKPVTDSDAERWC